jgi:hypothetical protein
MPGLILRCPGVPHPRSITRAIRGSTPLLREREMRPGREAAQTARRVQGCCPRPPAGRESYSTYRISSTRPAGEEFQPIVSGYCSRPRVANATVARSISIPPISPIKRLMTIETAPIREGSGESYRSGVVSTFPSVAAYPNTLPIGIRLLPDSFSTTGTMPPGSAAGAERKWIAAQVRMPSTRTLTVLL